MINSVPFIDLKAQQARIRERVEGRMSKVLDHGKYIMGPEVKELEGRLSEYCGVEYVVSCSSGTDAVWLPMLALGVGPGDAVFLPSWTFTATAEAVCLTGGSPIFVDVDDTFMNMDPASLAAAIEKVRSDGELTPKAVIPVDLFGIPAPYDRINAIAKSEGLSVVSDAAQSFGAKSGNRTVGALTDITATSFFPAKPLGCYGDGGAIFTDDPEIEETLRSIRIHGRGFGGKYDNIRVGTNARLDTMQAAVLLEKLEIFDEELALRQKIADRYADGLGDLVKVPTIPENATCAWAQYTIQVDDRDGLAAALKERGVPTNIYYPRPLHVQPPYEGYPRAPEGLPVTEMLAKKVLSLPMYPYLEDWMQAKVIDEARNCLERR